MSKGPEYNYPKARTADLISERIGDELVVYDGHTSEAHCLSPLAAAVFTAADGETSPARLAEFASAELGEEFGSQHVEMALAELEDRGLVTSPAESGGISRRGFVKRTAVVGGGAFGAAMVTPAMVTSVLTPAYGSAASLPQGFPSGFSSLAIRICGPDNKVYGADWGPSTTNGSKPSSFGATHANAFCGKWTITNSGWPTNVTQPLLTFVSGGVCIALPSGYTICEYAAFFGKGAPGLCGTQQCFTGGTPTLASCGYLITFDSTCYS